MLIVGYFKYLKPFLTDFNSIKKDIDVFIKNHKLLNTKAEDIRADLGKLVEIAQQEHKEITKDIAVEHKEYHNELLNLIKTVNKELEDMTNKSNTASNKSDDNHRNLMVEIAKLQTRIEYMQNPGMRGIQK